jgi:beta-glucosidase
MKPKELLNRLTTEEKVKWTAGNNMWTMLGNETLNIKPIFVADGPHGVRAYNEKPEKQMWGKNELAPSTMFPSAAAMASTWNEDLIYKVGQTIGKECNHYHVDVLLAPGVNLKRSPLAGRNFEYYSEDPYLTERMGVNFIKGVQSEKVGACVKHFALNEQEDQRRFINTIVDERTMHELYLKPFKNILKEANPVSIMSSYNKINGEYASESKLLLKDILRDKWGYTGCVISDWGAVQDKVKSLKNGMNIEMPGTSEFEQEVFHALENNELTIKEIEDSLLPVLELREYTLQNDLKGTKTNLEHNHQVAYEVSKEAIVLLKNDGILPLKEKQKILVIGEFAKTPRINGGGSATLKPFYLENPLQELSKLFDVTYLKGYQEESTTKELLNEIENNINNHDYVLFFTGTTEALETEGKEREHMNLPKGHIEAYQKIKAYNKNVIVILNNGGALDLTEIMDANAIIEAWLLGSSNGKALAEIICGQVNPSGRLSETIPYCIEHTPHYGMFPSKQDEVHYEGDLLRVGYRYYDTHKYPVRYPFGYGLSYTTFDYCNLTIDKNTMKEDEEIHVSIDITNTGKVSGKEVVQLYIHDQDSYYPVPYKELKQFQKVYLEPNQTKTVSFVLSKKDFEIYNVDYNDFYVEEGYFDVLIGSNVLDIKEKVEVYYHNPLSVRTTLTLDHTLKTFLQHKKEVIESIEKQYKKLEWYIIEQPAKRILKNLKQEFNISDDEYKKLIEELLK